jgi:2-C-methyl-D-erythritol 4-phosphate cytidylyltransferase
VSAERAALIVVAAGTGSRLGAGTHKALVSLAGATLLEHCLRRLLAASAHVAFAPVVAVGHRDDRAALTALLRRLDPAIVLVDGGARRQDSVAAGLRALPADAALVLVHDAARPFVPLGALPALLAEAANTGAALLAVPLADTVKEAQRPTAGASGSDGAPRVLRTVPRERLWAAQTPQAFATATLVRLLADAEARGITVTDEAALFEAAGLPVALVQGSRGNFKITTEDDLALARALLERERQA